MPKKFMLQALATSLCVVLGIGCSSSDEGQETGPAIAIDGGVSSTDAATRDASRSMDARMPRLDAAPPTNVPDATGTPEVCDGVDNDGDGERDNIDVGMDGVCDCLLLATLGVRGTFGVGDVFAQWLGSRSNNGATSLAGKTLTDELLAPYQVIVVEDIRKYPYSVAEIAALQRWVREGGGLFTLIGYGNPSERTNVNQILSAFNIQYGDQQVFKDVGTSTTQAITVWNPHPVSDMVTRIGAQNGYEVQGDGGVVVAMQNDLVALRAAEVEEGHVVVWGDEWITYNSEWTAHPEYQVERFWLNSIKWLTPRRECQVLIPLL